ncbi:MAG: hypothetical protein NTW49_09180 [Bacteroidia bacterium]|nr:hypothetical protein [Bacteroidia bacterium]
MNKNEIKHHQQEGIDVINDKHDHKPYWKRIHHSWIFWIFIFLMLAAITYYITSVDFSLAPHKQMMQPSENNMTP